jgi:ribonuclease BN (tRNA processing enzyme)
MGVTVTVLGCDASYPSAGGACSGYLVQSGSTSVWMDAGTGTMANLQRFVDIDALDGIVISHSHPDHWTDLLVYHHLVKYYRVRERVPVYSPRRVLELLEASNREAPPLDWHVVDETSSVRIGGMTFTFSRTDHPVETLAVRAEGLGAAVAYSADTGPAWSLSSLGARGVGGPHDQGIGLALVEATLDPEHEGVVQHLSGRQAGAMAETAGARALVLTHIDPGISRHRQLDEAKAVFRGPVSVATVGARYEVLP